jgi:hypothetical protein
VETGVEVPVEAEPDAPSHPARRARKAAEPAAKAGVEAEPSTSAGKVEAPRRRTARKTTSPEAGE